MRTKAGDLRLLSRLQRRLGFADRVPCATCWPPCGVTEDSSPGCVGAAGAKARRGASGPMRQDANRHMPRIVPGQAPGPRGFCWDAEPGPTRRPDENPGGSMMNPAPALYHGEVRAVLHSKKKAPAGRVRLSDTGPRKHGGRRPHAKIHASVNPFAGARPQIGPAANLIGQTKACSNDCNSFS
jgi:hypothetical protein